MTMINQAARKGVIMTMRMVGVASLTGSCYIIYSQREVFQRIRSNSSNNKTTFDRLLVGLSLADMLSSLMFFLGDWPVPQKGPRDVDDQLYSNLFPWARGTTGTCTAQGFFFHLGTLGSVLFSGCIAIQYVLTVRLKWTQSRMVVVEKFFFAFGILLPVVSGIALASTRNFNANYGGSCWLYIYPIVCGETLLNLIGAEEDPSSGQLYTEDWCKEYPNKRGQNHYLFAFLFGFMWVMSVLVLILISMILLYLQVRQQENRVKRWSQAAREGRNQKRVIRKAMLFIGVFVVMYLPAVGLAHIEFLPLLVENYIVAALLPLQGVLNALVYSGIAEKFLCNWTCLCCSSFPLLRQSSTKNDINNAPAGAGATNGPDHSKPVTERRSQSGYASEYTSRTASVTMSTTSARLDESVSASSSRNRFYDNSGKEGLQLEEEKSPEEGPASPIADPVVATDTNHFHENVVQEVNIHDGTNDCHNISKTSSPHVALVASGSHHDKDLEESGEFEHSPSPPSRRRRRYSSFLYHLREEEYHPRQPNDHHASNVSGEKNAFTSKQEAPQRRVPGPSTIEKSSNQTKSPRTSKRRMTTSALPAGPFALSNNDRPLAATRRKSYSAFLYHPQAEEEEGGEEENSVVLSLGHNTDRDSSFLDEWQEP